MYNFAEITKVNVRSEKASRINLRSHNISLRTTGVAHLNGKLYVLISNRDQISVFSASAPFTRQPRDIDMNGVVVPKDIIACTKQVCCYVADSTGVWMVNIEEKKHECKLWLHNGQVVSFSVSNGRVVVTDDDKLCIYSPSAECLLELPLNQDHLIGTLHAVQTPHNTIIICQSDFTKGRQCITEINLDGQIQRCYVSKDQDDRAKLNGPCYAIYDRMRHLLFVVDHFNRRVVIFDKNLRIQDILVKDENDQFSKMCFVEETNLLFLSMWYPTVDIHRIIFIPN